MQKCSLHEDITCCVHCRSEDFSEVGKTTLGYDSFRCSDCNRKFNERTATAFNYLEQPTDVIVLVVRWYLTYKLSLRDLVEMFQDRGFDFSHETVRGWTTKIAPLITEQLRKKRFGKAGESWYVDETYIKVKGKWVYLYRSVDRDGDLIDTMLSETRDIEAAKRFFRSAKKVTGVKPDRVTTDKHPSYPRAISTTLGKRVTHRSNQYLNNYTEQSHRPIKQRYYPMRGFGNFQSAAIFCRGFEETRNFFRINNKRKYTAAQKRNFRKIKNYSFYSMIREI